MKIITLEQIIIMKYNGGMDAKFKYTKVIEAIFFGYVFSRCIYVKLSKKFSLLLGRTLDKYIDSSLKVCLTLWNIWCSSIKVKVTFSSFRFMKPDDSSLDPFLIHTLTICFKPRRQVLYILKIFLYHLVWKLVKV
ncbi:hypothetical protein QQP08_004974 [Theobroma cacao]|nr:hypothetical protein QQP08_004974 [Theobroma cacao]